MVDIRCKGFRIKKVNDKLIVESSWQTFELRGINGNIRHLQRIPELITPTSTITELVDLFYSNDRDGLTKRQLVEMIPISRIKDV